MLDMHTCGDLRSGASRLQRAFANRPKTYSFLMRASLGLSSDEVADEEGSEIGSVGRKSLSNERTFAAEANPDELRTRLQSLCRQVAEEMAASVPPLAARTVELKTKAATFEVKSRQV